MGTVAVGILFAESSSKEVWAFLPKRKISAENFTSVVSFFFPTISLIVGVRRFFFSSLIISLSQILSEDWEMEIKFKKKKKIQLLLLS